MFTNFKLDAAKERGDRLLEISAREIVAMCTEILDLLKPHINEEELREFKLGFADRNDSKLDYFDMVFRLQEVLDLANNLHIEIPCHLQSKINALLNYQSQRAEFASRNNSYPVMDPALES